MLASSRCTCHQGRTGHLCDLENHRTAGTPGRPAGRPTTHAAITCFFSPTNHNITFLFYANGWGSRSRGRGRQGVYFVCMWVYCPPSLLISLVYSIAYLETRPLSCPGTHQANAGELALMKADCAVTSRRGKKATLVHGERTTTDCQL